jgi:membrane-associated phospholipid phosphatase
MRAVRRERWTPARALTVGGSLVSFYLTYMAYRNLKAIVPLLRPDDLFDRQLADIDRSLFFGHDPAALLHTLLGVGIPTQILSTAYAAFIVFLPLSLAVALVFSPSLRASIFYATALSVNWLLGAGSYFLLPSLGPVYAQPQNFAQLPPSEVTRLQDMLLDQRVAFLRDPASATPQSIAAFASLHISMSFAAAGAAHLLGLPRRLRIGLWIWFGTTLVATVYLGWHYVIDDIAGLLMGAAALALAWLATGIDLRAVRDRRPGVERAEAIGWDGEARGAGSPVRGHAEGARQRA